jgi:hypothetical protein
MQQYNKNYRRGRTTQEQCVELSALHIMLSCVSELLVQGEELQNVEPILVPAIALIHGLYGNEDH